MRIIMSPSKTKTIQGRAERPLFDEGMTTAIANSLAALSVEQLMKLLKVKEDLAASLHEVYMGWTKEAEGAAIDSYTGQAFKALDWPSLSKGAQDFGTEHIVLLSAMYGIVHPLSPIKAYRVDLENPLQRYGGPKLEELWQPLVTSALAKEDTILNLASKEYAALVKHPNVVSVQFLEWRGGQWKQMSTSSKRLRGRMVRHICEETVDRVEDLPMSLEGFTREAFTKDEKEEFAIRREKAKAFATGELGEENFEDFILPYYKKES